MINFSIFFLFFFSLFVNVNVQDVNNHALLRHQSISGDHLL